MAISLLLMLLSKPAYGQDFQTMKQGEVAPFNGALVTPDGVATIISKHEEDVSICEENSKHEIEKLKIFKDAQISKLDFEFKTCQETNKSIIETKDKELDRAYEIIKKQNKNMVPLWLGIGFATGLATSFGTYYVYDSINNN